MVVVNLCYTFCLPRLCYLPFQVNVVSNIMRNSHAFSQHRSSFMPLERAGIYKTNLLLEQFTICYTLVIVVLESDSTVSHHPISGLGFQCMMKLGRKISISNGSKFSSCCALGAVCPTAGIGYPRYWISVEVATVTYNYHQACIIFISVYAISLPSAELNMHIKNAYSSFLLLDRTELRTSVTYVNKLTNVRVVSLN